MGPFSRLQYFQKIFAFLIVLCYNKDGHYRFDLQNKYDCHFVSRINDELICKFTDENATIIKEPL